jgi:hypothetical protein
LTATLISFAAAIHYRDLTTRHRAEEFQIGDNRSIPAARISYSQLLPGCRLTTDKPTFCYVGS